MKTTRSAVPRSAVKKKTTPPPDLTVVTELPRDATVLGKPPAPAPELTVQDIADFRQILEVVSGRGVFRPEEMTLVGSTYTRLTAFLEASRNG